MANGLGRTASLTRIGLTLTPPPRRVRRFFVAVALVAIAFAAGFGAHELVREPPPLVVAPAAATPNPELAQLRQQLEQAQLGLRVADSRGQELERQVDTLNQKLTESQDELTFFRKAREGRKH